MQFFIRLVLALLVCVYSTQVFAVSYTGTDYTIDLPKGSWETILRDTSGEIYDEFDGDEMMIQVFGPDSNIYTVIKSGNKKDIASIFLAYKKAIESKDMKKERMKKGKSGTIYYSSFSFTIKEEGSIPARYYGYVCIVNNDATKSAYMINILQNTPVNQTRAFTLCNSIRPLES